MGTTVRVRNRDHSRPRSGARSGLLRGGSRCLRIDPGAERIGAADRCLQHLLNVEAGGEVGSPRRPLETSRPGVFAIGDVRSGSVKRVAAAVGEGAQVVASLHAYLAAAV